MATFLGTESVNTTDYGNVSGDEDSTSMNSESEERDIDLIVQMMRSKKYAEYLKGLMSEVVESKIGPRLDYCESQIHDMKIKVDKLELKAAERQSGESDLVIEVSRLKSELNDLEQYGRRNNLRIFGIPEAAGEDTTEVIKQIAQDKLGVSLDEKDIDRSHRVGKLSDKLRAILVKFTSYRARNIVIKQRRKLKGSKITIHEDLTRKNQELLMKSSKQTGVVSAWSQDGRVFVSVLTSTPGKHAKVPIRCYSDWQNLPDEKSYQMILKQLEEKTKNRTTQSDTPEYQGMLTRNRTGSLQK